MANFSSNVEVVRRVRYTLDTPDNLTELSKAISAAIRAWQDMYGSDMSDDSIRVSVEDGTIVLWWEEKTSA